jgi:mediator of RNA polymerase II transcription subunit 13
MEKTKQTQSLVVYVIVPTTFANFSHPAASHVISVMADINEANSNTPGRLLFHLVPEIFVFHSATLSQVKDFGMEQLTLSVYDSIPQITERQHSRLSNKSHQMHEINDAHAFILANRKPTKPNFVENWPPPVATMFDQYNFLHIAYDISADGEWVIAAVVTERGEDTQTHVWKVDDNESIPFAVKSVLDFTMKEARKANVEWRVTISKNGPMLALELDGEIF